MKLLHIWRSKANSIFKTLPPKIGNLYNATHLSLYGTMLEYLPESKIITLTESIGDLKNLKRLYLGRSKILKIPKLNFKHQLLHKLST